MRNAGIAGAWDIHRSPGLDQTGRCVGPCELPAGRPLRMPSRREPVRSTTVPCRRSRRAPGATYTMSGADARMQRGEWLESSSIRTSRTGVRVRAESVSDHVAPPSDARPVRPGRSPRSRRPGPAGTPAGPIRSEPPGPGSPPTVPRPGPRACVRPTGRPPRRVRVRRDDGPSMVLAWHQSGWHHSPFAPTGESRMSSFSPISRPLLTGRVPGERSNSHPRFPPSCSHVVV